MKIRAFQLFLPFGALMLFGCDSGQSVQPAAVVAAPSLGKGTAPSGFATLAKLPPITGGAHGEAYAVNHAGSVIAGYSWDRYDRMNPVTWTFQNGAWTVTAFAYPASATSAVARGVNDQGDLAGYDYPSTTSHPLIWFSAGGFSVLGCGDTGEVYAISSGGQTLAGTARANTSRVAALWNANGCREDLPLLAAGGSSHAGAVNSNATIVGGNASLQPGYSVPVRWRWGIDGWQVEQLDSRRGNVYGSNSAGDLVGSVQIPCASATTSCSRGIIWYAAGNSRELGTLGGESTTPRAINASGEVVGLSSLADGKGTAFIWSETVGMRQLPVSGGAWAFAVSGVRPDGTRLVVGAGGKPFSALAWVVR